MSKKTPLILVILVLFSSMLAVPSYAQKANCSDTYTVQTGDWLSKIAERYLGDMMAYLSIVEATNEAASIDDGFTAINNPNVIEVGQKLCIPSKTGVAKESVPVEEPVTVDNAGSEITPIYETLVRKPEGDVEEFWNLFDWTDLTQAEQALWEKLGWNEASWQEEAEAPASESKLWNELTDEERATAEQLGYDKQSWDATNK
jgi:LysM repeat protein